MDVKSFQNSISPENYFYVMAIVEISNESVIRMQTGLKYFKMGYSIEYNRGDIKYFVPPPIRSITTLSFLAIPLDFNYSLPFLSNVYLSGGIEGAKVISANSVAQYNDGTKAEDDIIEN